MAPSLRVLLLLLAASLPPLIVFGVATALNVDRILGVGPGTLLVIVSVLAAAWGGVVAVLGARSVAGDLRSLLQLAERGAPPEAVAAGSAETAESGAAHRRLARLLGERDQQIEALARQAATVPITGDLSAVAAHVVRAARGVTSDATWALAVLNVDGSLLPAGAYGPDGGPPEPLADLHRWASVAGEDESDPGRARQVDGPWGSFVVIDTATGPQLHAILLAPWEGRAKPSPADLTLFGLVGQHAAAALEHAALYARVHSQAEELNRLAAVQADFLRGITHDLQTPLTSIAALASELGAMQGLPTAAREELDGIAYQAERMHRMVSQLLTMSRLEAGAIHPRSEVFRVEPIVRRVWNSLRVDRSFALTNSGPERLAIGDPDRLEQALWAVLDNAVKYSPPRSTVSVELDAPGANGSAGMLEQITIRNEGIGMDAAALQQATDRFYRSSDARRLVPDGSGIGLYTARQLMLLMGGSLSIDSRPAEGATVRLALPAEPIMERVPQPSENPRG
jgi:signal transduction histidine kinase